MTETISKKLSVIAENTPKVYDAGVEAGKKAEYDAFWDGVTDKGNRVSYNAGFSNWGFEYIRPNRKIIFKSASSGSSTFNGCKYLKKIEAAYFDFSQKVRGTNSNNGFYYTFFTCPALEEIEDIGLLPDYVYDRTFMNSGKLRIIACITVDENTQFNNTFYGCTNLTYLIIKGTIGQNGFDIHWSTLLARDSIMSIINALSATTTGLTVTLSLAAVNKAFETSAGANDGSTSSEWLALTATKSNWTISLI